MSQLITKDDFGTSSGGKPVERFTLANKNGVKVQIITIGGIITSIQCPDRQGEIADITLGYDNVPDYEANPAYFGAIVGRVAGRIDKGKFTLDGKEYNLVLNDHYLWSNHLHGGIDNFSKRIWTPSIEGEKLHLSLTSPDGDQGYPGEVKVKVIYELNDENELVIDYTATSDKPTPIDLTNHAYFNLKGHDSGTIYDQVIMMPTDKLIPKNENNVSAGDIGKVDGTLYDLHKSTPFGERLNKFGEPDGGIEITYCIEGPEKKKFVGRVEDPTSGRILDTYTSAQGCHLYTGNFLNGVKGKEGAIYNRHGAFCLETQGYQNAINIPNFPDCVLRPGQTYRQTTWFKFGVKA